MLNEVKGNMYDWITHTWNTVKGECPHECEYCYMKKWGPQKPVRFVESELKTDLGSDNFIFVGSSCDLFAEEILDTWIIRTLIHCRKYQSNKYLFQSKNPQRIYDYRVDLPRTVVLGTTIESDFAYEEMGFTPHPTERAKALLMLKKKGFKTIITIEPIMDFNLEELVGMIANCRPNWVNIGANTNHKIELEEPPRDKIKRLIKRLMGITEVKMKPNLKRLLAT